MAEILPKRRKTLFNQSIMLSFVAKLTRPCPTRQISLFRPCIDVNVTLEYAVQLRQHIDLIC